MRTSELIAALAADPVPEPIRLGRRVAAAIVLGLIGSLAIYALFLGPRPDIAEAGGRCVSISSSSTPLRSPCRRCC